MNLKSILSVSALALVGAANAVTLSVFNFNDAGASGTNSASNTAALFASDRTATGVSAALSSNFGAANIANFGGSTVGADGGDPAGQALALQGGTGNVNNGGYLQLLLSSTTGALRLDTLTFAAQRTSAGFTSQAFSYSLNGTDFTPLSTVTGIPAAFALQTVSLAAVPAASTIYIRSVLTGATATDALGNNRIDNLVVAGTVQSVPEPGAFAALGLGALGLLRRRRAAK